MFLRCLFGVLMLTCLTNISQAQAVKSSLGKGINFQAADSSMSVKMQFRFQSLFSGTTTLEENADWSTNAMIRRSRLKFDGFVFNPKFRYKIELGLSNRDISPASDFEQVAQGSRIILDAVGKYALSENIDLWVGQTKLPGNRERIISSQKLDLVNRSLVNSRFNIDRDMGIQLRGKYDVNGVIVKPEFALSKGEGRNITASNIGGYEYTAKLEVLPMGAFTKGGDYFGADLVREETPKLAIAAAYDLNQGASRQRANLGSFLVDSVGNYLDADLSVVFADLMFKYKGVMVMAEFAHRTASKDVLSADGKGYATGTGYNFHTSYVFSNNWALSGRYTYIEPDDEVYSSVTQTSEYTFGVSRYIKGHSLKFQSDASLIDTGAENLDLRIRFQVEIAI